MKIQSHIVLLHGDSSKVFIKGIKCHRLGSKIVIQKNTDLGSAISQKTRLLPEP